MRWYSICLSVWFISPSIMATRLIPIVANGRVSFFLWLNTIPLFVYTIFALSVHPSVDIFGISISWLLNDASVDERGQISFGGIDFISFGHIPRSRIAGSHGRVFFFINFHIVFHNGYTILHSYMCYEYMYFLTIFTTAKLQSSLLEVFWDIHTPKIYG